MKWKGKGEGGADLVVTVAIILVPHQLIRDHVPPLLILLIDQQPHDILPFVIRVSHHNPFPPIEGFIDPKPTHKHPFSRPVDSGRSSGERS